MFSLLALLLPLAPTHQDGLTMSPELALEGQLAQARAAFAAADRDRDGALDAAEIRAAGIPLAAAGAHDADADGRLSPDEFLVYYRSLLRNAGRRVEPELDRAVRDILAELRQGTVQRDGAERSRSAAVKAIERGRMRTTAEARERLERAREGLAERPERATRIREGVLPVAAPEALGLEEARTRLAQARGLLEDREERLAAARRRVGTPPEEDVAQRAALEPEEGVRSAVQGSEGPPPSERPPGDPRRAPAEPKSAAGVAGGQPLSGAAGQDSPAQGSEGPPTSDPPGPRAEIPGAGDPEQP